MNFFHFSSLFNNFLAIFPIMTDKINGIKKFRERMHIKTQGDLAEALGVEQTTVSVWEINKGTPKTETMRKLLEIGATVEELFGIEYNKKHNLVEKEPPSQVQVQVQASSEMTEVLDKLEQIESRLKKIESDKKPKIYY
jgi:DNA-binding XRE family transcriptional regulator